MSKPGRGPQLGLAPAFSSLLTNVVESVLQLCGLLQALTCPEGTHSQKLSQTLHFVTLIPL